MKLENIIYCGDNLTWLKKLSKTKKESMRIILLVVKEKINKVLEDL